MSTLNEVYINDTILLVPGGQKWLVLERLRVIEEHKVIFHLVSDTGVFKVLPCEIDKGDLSKEIWFVFDD